MVRPQESGRLLIAVYRQATCRLRICLDSREIQRPLYHTYSSNPLQAGPLTAAYAISCEPEDQVDVEEPKNPAATFYICDCYELLSIASVSSNLINQDDMKAAYGAHHTAVRHGKNSRIGKAVKVAELDRYAIQRGPWLMLKTGENLSQVLGVLQGLGQVHQAMRLESGHAMQSLTRFLQGLRSSTTAGHTIRSDPF